VGQKTNTDKIDVVLLIGSWDRKPKTAKIDVVLLFDSLHMGLHLHMGYALVMQNLPWFFA